MSGQGRSWREGEDRKTQAGTEARAMEERVACWFAFHGLLSLFSYTTQNPPGTDNRGLSQPTANHYQENASTDLPTA